MYWLIGKVNPFIEKLNNNTNSQEFLREFESLDKNVYYQSSSQPQREINPDLDESSTLNEFSSVNDDASNIGIQSKKTFLSTSKSIIDASNKKLKRDHSKAYAPILKGLDVLSMAIVVITVVFNIAEADLFFEVNKQVRITGTFLVNYMKDYPHNNSWSGLMQSSLNFSHHIFSKNKELPIELIICNYANNFHKTGEGFYSDVINDDFVLAFNLSPSTFTYEENSAYPIVDNFTIPFKSNREIDQYRTGMLIGSLLSMFLSFLSNYLGFILQKNLLQVALPFYRTHFLYIFLLDSFFFSLFPYPNLYSYHYYEYSGKVKCFPYSTYFSMMVNFRLFYLIKALNFSSWNNRRIKEKCEKNQLKHSLVFVMKCFEMAHPFLFIFSVLGSFTLIFGLNIRLSEMYFWDAQLKQWQNWEDYFNSLWFVISTMMRLDTGDYSSKTHLARFFDLFVCVSGIYVVTSLMVNLTKAAVMNAKEEKVYTLIKRLDYKAKIREENSRLIYYSLQSVLLKKKIRRNKLQSKTIEAEYANKRLIHKCLTKKKSLQREMKKFDFIPSQELIIDLIEKLEVDIKEIDKEVVILQKVNQLVTEFLDTQRKIMINVRQSVISTKQLFTVIDKSKPAFGKLHNYNRRALIEEFGFDYSSNDSLRKYFDNSAIDDNCSPTERRRTNPNQFENLISNQMVKENKEEEEEEHIISKDNTHIINSNLQIEDKPKQGKSIFEDYQVSKEEFLSHFQDLFFEFNQNTNMRYFKYHSVKKSGHKKLLTDQIFKKQKNDVTFEKIEEKIEEKERMSDNNLNKLS